MPSPTRQPRNRQNSLSNNVRDWVWHARIWRLTWPVILANLTIPMVGAVDTAVMGRMPDPKHIGAVALGATAFTAIYWLFGFLRMGTTGLTAQALGANHSQSIHAIALRSLIIAGVLGVLLVALQRPIAYLLFELIFSGSAAVESLAVEYFSIRIWSAPATLLYVAELGILFGLQRMGATLIIGLLLNLTNVLLDLLFVVGFGWGVAGVAMGTLLSEWFAASTGLVVVWWSLRQHGPLNRPKNLWQRDKVLALWQISINLVIRTFFVQAPFLFFTALGASLGNTLLAANAVLMQFYFVTIYAMDAFAHTAETLAGHAYGAGDPDEFRKAARYTTFWAGLLATVAGFVFWLFGPWLVSLLTTLPEVQAAAIEYLPWLMFAPLISVWAFQLDGIYIGTTQIVTLRNAMFLSFGVYLAALGLTYNSWHNHGVWFAMLAFMLARGVLLGLKYPKLARQIDAQAAIASGGR